MTSLIIVVMILAVLCCNYQVHSKFTQVFKEYKINRNLKVITGKRHVYKNRNVYAICDENTHQRNINCDVKLYSNVFDNASKQYSCTVPAIKQSTRGKLQILGVHLMNGDKVIFSALDVNQDNSRQAQATILTIGMEKCEIKLKTFDVENRHHVPQVFLIPFENKYVFVFKDKTKCGDLFCKVTVHDNGESSIPVKWFYSNQLVHDVEALEDNSGKFMLVTDLNGDTVHSILDNAGRTVLVRQGTNDVLGWSTSNGIYSFCDQLYCQYYNEQGRKINELNLDVHPRNYTALYNLEEGGHIALICFDDNLTYRLARIGKDGKLKDSIDMAGTLLCHYEFKFIQFSKENDEAYCLSMFNYQHGFRDWYIFRKVCFTNP